MIILYIVLGILFALSILVLLLSISYVLIYMIYILYKCIHSYTNALYNVMFPKETTSHYTTFFSYVKHYFLKNS